MSRMFKLWKESRIVTMNPSNGCGYHCYGGCWAERQAKMKQGHPNPKVREGYENGFKPYTTLIPRRMEVPNADVVWIWDMGDVAFQPTENVVEVIKKCIEENPDTLFFLESKNPTTFNRFIDRLPENVMLSTTIESDEQPGWVSNAPGPRKRFEDFTELDWGKKHVSIEPIMEFDTETMVLWLYDIVPEIVSVGYDNYNCGLPEPTPQKFWKLVEGLGEFTNVEIKTPPEEKKEAKK